MRRAAPRKLSDAVEDLERSEEEKYLEWEARRKNVLRGRLTPDVYREISQLGSNDATTDAVRQYYGIGEQQWIDLWKDKPTAILEILERGKQRGVFLAANKLMEHVQEGDLKAIMFYLKTVGKWREMDKQVEDEKARPIFPAITLTVNDPVEAAKIYQKVMMES